MRYLLGKYKISAGPFISVSGPNPLVATIFLSTANQTSPEQDTASNRYAFTSVSDGQGMPLKQVVDSFILTCNVEGKPDEADESNSDKLKDFLWFAKNNNLHIQAFHCT